MGKSINENSISIIIPSYNAENTILNALDSINKQTFFSYIKEVIVINDGSTDNTAKKVNEFKKSHSELLIYLINKKNGGVSSARNEGLKFSTGEWIALLDSDDEWFPKKLEIQINTLLNNGSIDFLGGDYNGKGVKIFGKKITELHHVSLKELCLTTFPQTSTVIFKRKIYEELGGYNENRSYCEDAQYFMKICNIYNFYYLPGQVVSYGGGKRGFGESGLSRNYQEMHKGSLINIKELKESKEISLFFYIFLRFFYLIKYIRRILIIKWR